MNDVNIDWAKAPEGATHYLPEQKHLGWVPCWYKRNSEGKWMLINSQSLEYDSNPEWKIDLDLDNIELVESLLVHRPAVSTPENSVEISWNQAPEDATHYLPEYEHFNWSGDYWYKRIGNDWWLVPCEEVLGGYWEWCIDDWDVEIFEPLLIRRPIPFNPEDSVEVRCNGWSDWQIGTLKYKSDAYVIVLHEDGEQIYVPYQSGFEMRSPMSEEDKQRQKVISEMEKVLNIHIDTISDEDIELVCKVLYDEWYSKQDSK